MSSTATIFLFSDILFIPMWIFFYVCLLYCVCVCVCIINIPNNKRRAARSFAVRAAFSFVKATLRPVQPNVSTIPHRNAIAPHTPAKRLCRVLPSRNLGRITGWCKPAGDEDRPARPLEMFARHWNAKRSPGFAPASDSWKKIASQIDKPYRRYHGELSERAVDRSVDSAKRADRRTNDKSGAKRSAIKPDCFPGQIALLRQPRCSFSILLSTRPEARTRGRKKSDGGAAEEVRQRGGRKRC